MECNFVVGQKVVCVDATVWRTDGSATNVVSGLVVGSTYEISSVSYAEFGIYKGKNEPSVIVTLKGFLPHKSWGTCRGAFDCRRFRPIVTRKTDISIFTNMLRDLHADA